MKILLVGGPYDYRFYDIRLDGNGMPELNVLNMPHMTTIKEGVIECLSNAPAAPLPFLRYRLKRVPERELIDGCLRDSPAKWHWEYHFEG